jgi:hypothetical protein
MIEVKERIFVKVVFEKKAATVVATAQHGRIGNHDTTPIPPIQANHFGCPAPQKNLALYESHR